MNKKRNILKPLLIYAIVLIVVAAAYFGSIYAYNTFFAVKPKPVSVQQPVVAGAPTVSDASVEGTEETVVAPNTLDSYVVDASMPRFLTIDRLNMKARIQQMGINTDGAVQAPVNIHDSGWYKGSAKPGTPGAAFIDGHASGNTRKGLFAYIDTLKNGDSVKVEQGDGEVFTYRVVHSETVPKDSVDMGKALTVYGGAEEGLNLMTCTGRWIANQETYDERVVVYTQRVS